MGLFTPKWMKDMSIAEKTIRFSVDYNDLKTLYRMALKCPFPDCRSKAIRGLKECQFYDETTQYLQRLISEGVTAHDRCLAAALFDDKKTRQIVFQKDLAEANRERPEVEWFFQIRNPSHMVRIYPEVGKEERQVILSKLKELPDFFAIAELESSEELLAQIVKRLSRERRQLSEAVVKTRNMGFLTAALPFLDADDLPVLNRLSQLVQNGAIKRSLGEVAQKLSAEPELFNETLQKTPGNDFLRAALPYVQECDFPILAAFLEDESRKELWPQIARMLVRQAPHYYGDLCYDKLSQEEKLYAIQNRLVSKKTIFQVAKNWRYSSPLYREALHRISEPADAIALMKVKDLFSSTTPGELENYAYLAGVAAKDPEKLADFLLDCPANLKRSAIPVVVGKLNDQQALIRLACSGTDAISTEAAKRLSPLNCKAILHKLSKKARTAATDIYFSYALGFPQELCSMKQEVLLEGYKWANVERNDKLARNVIDYLGGEARVAALKYDIVSGNDRNTEALTAGIDDGDALISLAFYHTRDFEPIVCRIRELAEADPALEKRFTDAARKELSDHLEYADRLALYYQLPVPEALWRYAGSAFIQELLDILNQKEGDAYERITPYMAAECLGEIYRTVSESRTVLSRHRGAEHRIHHDYPSPSCGSEHDDFVSAVQTNW